MVSVVIPAYNEERNIAKTLDTLCSQTYSDFEVVVVNNASTDRTVEVTKSYSDRLNVKVVDEMVKGRGIARSTGFDVATGDIIFSTDSDTFPRKDWIETGLQYFKDQKVIAVTGPWYIHDCSRFTNFFVNNYQKLAVLPYRLTFGHYWLTGLNFAIRKDVYVNAGGFDKTINSHEDEEITWRVRKFGKIIYADDFIVDTSGRRWKKGVVAGLWSYQKTAIFYFLLKNKTKILSDVR